MRIAPLPPAMHSKIRSGFIVKACEKVKSPDCGNRSDLVNDLSPTDLALLSAKMVDIFVRTPNSEEFLA